MYASPRLKALDQMTRIGFRDFGTYMSFNSMCFLVTKMLFNFLEQPYSGNGIFLMDCGHTWHGLK